MKGQAQDRLMSTRMGLPVACGLVVSSSREGTLRSPRQMRVGQQYLAALPSRPPRMRVLGDERRRSNRFMRRTPAAIHLLARSLLALLALDGDAVGQCAAAISYLRDPPPEQIVGLIDDDIVYTPQTNKLLPAPVHLGIAVLDFDTICLQCTCEATEILIGDTSWTADWSAPAGGGYFARPDGELVVNG